MNEIGGTPAVDSMEKGTIVRIKSTGRNMPHISRLFLPLWCRYDHFIALFVFVISIAAEETRELNL